MNKKQSLTLGIIAALCLTFTVIGCKKDSKNDTDTQSAQDNSQAEGDYNDATTMVDVAVTNGANFTFRQATNGTEKEETLLSTCATVTVDTINSPRSIIIDFGANNCLCLDLRYRRGKIKASYTGKYRDSGTVVNITYDNYFVNNNQIKGTHTTTNLGKNASNHLVYQVVVDGQIVKADNGGTITWKSNRKREWMEGASTPTNFADDVYSITGTASGTTAAGENYTINITQALVRKLACRWFESGKIDITPSGKATRTLDYGSTGCDNNATVTINGVSFPVSLP